MIRQVGPEALAQYASVPISFQVSSRLVVTADLALIEEPVDPPYLKDYDEEGSPLTWPNRFDLTNWAFFLAQSEERTVGGAALVFDTPGLSVLWDIRVHPKCRGQAVGGRLFQASVELSRERGRHQMKCETQDNNVSACRFYARQGCRLGGVDRHGYAGTRYVHEAMLLWYTDL